MYFSLQGRSAPAAPAAPTAATPAGSRDLPELQRPSPRRSSGGVKVVVFLVIIVAVAVGIVAGVPGVGKSLKGLFASSASDLVTYRVKPTTLSVTVSERGSLESSKNEDVYCQVEGQTTIIKIVPEGTRVKKGEVVCELDASALKDNLINQEITTKGAFAAYQQSKLTREVAEIAVKEYVEGIFKQDQELADGDVALAKSDLQRAVDRMEWSDRMFAPDKGYVSKAQNLADHLAWERAKFAVEQAQTKRKVLIDFTKGKTIKELESEVEKAKSDELAKEATYQLEKSKEEKLNRQIKNCTLIAPNDGLVVYANDPNRFGGQNQLQIEEGATVRERQKIFSLPDVSKMQVNTKVHESMVDKLSRGLRARIRVDAFASEVLPGEVDDVATLPDPSSFFSSDVKVYTTKVRLEKTVNGIRPGMTAQVDILVTEKDNILTVPVQGILQFKGKDHVAIRTPNGYDWRDVTLGLSNDQHVEIVKGLTTGDVVILNPVSLMSDEEKRDAFGGLGKEVAKKDWGTSSTAGAAGAPGAGAPGAVGIPGKGAPGAVPGKGGVGADGKAKAKRGGGNFNPALFQKFRNIPDDERARMKTASPEERAEIMKKAGFTDAEIQQLSQMRQGGGGGFGGRGGGGGFGGPGGGGGGFGGPGGPGGGGGGGFGGPPGGGGGFGGRRGGPDQ